MQLEEFVSETIRQIIAGIKKSHEHAAKHGAKINPSNMGILGRDSSQVASLINTETRHLIDKIDFDVAISTSEGSKEKTGAGVFVAGLSFGTQDQAEENKQSLSRVKFSIPIQYP